MTGRELIVFLLKNNLEDEEIGDILSQWFMSEVEAAEKFNVGLSTIEAWFNHKQIDGIKIGSTIYISKSTKPRI